MARKRIIKTVRLEQMFNLFHSTFNLAEQCLEAIASVSDNLMYENPSLEQSIAVTNMQSEIDEWCDQFAQLGSMMQQAESPYFDHLCDDNKNVELIADVPQMDLHYLPAEDDVTLFLLQIDCPEEFKEDIEDQYGVHDFSMEGVISDIRQLDSYLLGFFKALGSAKFTGVWEEAGQVVADICRYKVRDAIRKVVKLYGSQLDGC